MLKHSMFNSWPLPFSSLLPPPWWMRASACVTMCDVWARRVWFNFSVNYCPSVLHANEINGNREHRACRRPHHGCLLPTLQGRVLCVVCACLLTLVFPNELILGHRHAEEQCKKRWKLPGHVHTIWHEVVMYNHRHVLCKQCGFRRGWFWPS